MMRAGTTSGRQGQTRGPKVRPYMMRMMVLKTRMTTGWSSRAQRMASTRLQIQMVMVPSWNVALLLRYLRMALERKQETKNTRLMMMGAFLSNSGWTDFIIDPDDSMMTRMPVIFLSVGRCTAIMMSFLLFIQFLLRVYRSLSWLKWNRDSSSYFYLMIAGTYSGWQMNEYIYWACFLSFCFSKYIGLSQTQSHFMHTMIIMRGIMLRAHIMIQVSLTTPVPSQRAKPKIKEIRPPRLSLMIGAVPKYGAIFFEVMSLMQDGMTATKVPTVHPIPNLKIISRIIYVYIVVIVKISANMEAVNRIDLGLWFLIKKLQAIVPQRAPRGDITDKNALVVTTFPVKLNSLQNSLVVLELTMAAMSARLNPKKNRQEVTIITALACFHMLRSILALGSIVVRGSSISKGVNPVLIDSWSEIFSQVPFGMEDFSKSGLPAYLVESQLIIRDTDCKEIYNMLFIHTRIGNNFFLMLALEFRSELTLWEYFIITYFYILCNSISSAWEDSFNFNCYTIFSVMSALKFLSLLALYMVTFDLPIQCAALIFYFFLLFSCNSFYRLVRICSQMMRLYDFALLHSCSLNWMQPFLEESTLFFYYLIRLMASFFSLASSYINWLKHCWASSLSFFLLELAALILCSCSSILLTLLLFFICL